MDSYISGIRAILTATALSPAPSGVRPAPLHPQAVFPALTVQQIGGSEVENLASLSELTEAVMQINAWSPNYEVAFSLRRAVVLRLAAASGNISGLSGLSLDKVTGFRYAELFQPELELHQLILRCTSWWKTP